jgi:type VI secretion system secreted protein Hcp
MSAVASVFAAFGVVAPAEAAVDYFLEVNGVQGESQDAKFAKSIDIESYAWGASNGRKGVTLQDLSITKRLDLASPPLFQRLVQGTSIPSMELIGRKAGETQQIFLRFCFQDVQVSSVSQGGGTGGDNPSEHVTFGYTSVSEQYTAGNPDGKTGTTVFAGWNSSTGDLIGTYPNPCGF